MLYLVVLFYLFFIFVLIFVLFDVTINLLFYFTIFLQGRYIRVVMQDYKISIYKIKAILSMVSMSLLSIQHFVGLFADGLDVSYIPLSVTFLTIFIGSMDADKMKDIRRVSLFLTILVAFSGCVLYTVNSYDISVDKGLHLFYNKFLFGCIGFFSLFLSILYIKSIRELE